MGQEWATLSGSHIFVLKRVGQGGALGGAEGGAILLNLKAQVGQVGHFVRRVCIRENL